MQYTLVPDSSATYAAHLAATVHDNQGLDPLITGAMVALHGVFYGDLWLQLPRLATTDDYLETCAIRFPEQHGVVYCWTGPGHPQAVHLIAFGKINADPTFDYSGVNLFQGIMSGDQANGAFDLRVPAAIAWNQYTAGEEPQYDHWLDGDFTPALTVLQFMVSQLRHIGKLRIEQVPRELLVLKD